MTDSNNKTKSANSKSANSKSPTPESTVPAIDKSKKKKKRQDDGSRETIESIAIAFILAFLFKTFQAEAYVIPTGSMAPTLYGRHKEVTCDGCGFSFAVGASSEIDQETGQLDWRLKFVYCQNCGKRSDATDAAVFNGDRILVNKQVAEFKRFDVVVFKNPEQGHVNYIKRLVGLPNETIRIRKGDIWAQPSGSDAWQIQRKADPFVQKHIQLTVYDDKFPARPLLEQGWPERWVPAVESSADGSVGGWIDSENSWQPDRTDRTYACNADSDELQWLRYRHFLANESTWPDPDQVHPELPRPTATLITDFCTFNAYDSRYPNGGDFTKPTGIYWTGDLTLNATITVEVVQPGAALVLELVEGPQTFNCSIDLNSGAATISVVTGEFGTAAPMAIGSTSMTGAGAYELAFANVDDRICLWVNNTLVEFNSGCEYQSSDVSQPGQRDLAPCGIAVSNATVGVSSLLLERDIYYRNEALQFTREQGISRTQGSQREVLSERQLQMLVHDPEAWAKTYQDEVVVQLENYGHYGDYQLDEGEYLMFGDNSSMSKDSRLFDYQSRPIHGVMNHRYAVRQEDLIGKALYIFWPHGIPFLNGGKGFAIWGHSGETLSDQDGKKNLDPKDYPAMRFPFYPNLSRMKKIR